jgi:hypothetical protein
LNQKGRSSLKGRSAAALAREQLNGGITEHRDERRSPINSFADFRSGSKPDFPG